MKSDPPFEKAGPGTDPGGGDPWLGLGAVGAWRRRQRRFLRLVRIFISSPSDVAAARELAGRTVEELQRSKQISRHLTLRPLLWETRTPPVFGVSPQETVEKYMGASDQVEVFILLMHARLGTPLIAPGSGRLVPSGTEHELDVAYRAFRKHGKPIILVYRCTQPPPPGSDPVDVERVREFWKLFEGERRKYEGREPGEFESLAGLETLLRRDLGDVLDGFIRLRFPVPVFVAAGLLALALLVIGGVSVERWRAARQVDDIVTAALAESERNVSPSTIWKPVTERLALIGPRAIEPVFQSLGKRAVYDRFDQMPTLALVRALSQIAANGEREAVCERLRHVLELGHSPPLYPKSTHRIVIEEGFVPVGCTAQLAFLCRYLAHVSSRDFVDHAQDLVDLRDALAEAAGDRDGAARCFAGEMALE
jgi:hypothetical protein